MENLKTIELIMADYSPVINSKIYSLETKIEDIDSCKTYTNIGLIVLSVFAFLFFKDVSTPTVISSICTIIAYLSIHFYFFKMSKKHKKELLEKTFYKNIKIEDKNIKKLILHVDWTLEQMCRIGLCLKNKNMNYEDLYFLFKKSNEQDNYLEKIEGYNFSSNENHNVTSISDFEYNKNVSLFKRMVKQKGIKIAI